MYGSIENDSAIKPITIKNGLSLDSVTKRNALRAESRAQSVPGQGRVLELQSGGTGSAQAFLGSHSLAGIPLLSGASEEDVYILAGEHVSAA